MLTHLYIKNFTIIETAGIELGAGFTVLTGETGAGKSILIEALQMVLGERADTSWVKQGAERGEVVARFDLTHNFAAEKWLRSNDLNSAGSSCLIRRVIAVEGRSRHFINDIPCSVQSLKQLGALLVHIHGQHQHQALLKSDYQRALLDQYANNVEPLKAVRSTHQKWHAAVQKLTELIEQDPAHHAEFLNFQLQEFEVLGLQQSELAALEVEHRQLAHGTQWIQSVQATLNILAEDERQNVLQGLYAAQGTLKNLPEPYQTNMGELLRQAILQIEEANAELKQALETLELNPERLQWIEQRLAYIHEMARKHRVLPERLWDAQQKLVSQFQEIENRAEYIKQLEQEIKEQEKIYQAQADILTQARKKSAKLLSQAITEKMKHLGMSGGAVEIELTPKILHSKSPAVFKNTVYANGNEDIHFLVHTHPGESFQALSKIVSGGELSRIALAIQVIIAQNANLPTLIFDEVDVGIGGGIAEKIGQQLKALGKNAQVLSITHLPQVAAQGQYHLQVQKQIKNQVVKTQIKQLNYEERVQEIARMSGGVNLTQKTLAHAREMLES